MNAPRPELTGEPNEFKISLKEKTPSGFYKYKVNLPLNPSDRILKLVHQHGAEFPVDRVGLTFYSENALTGVTTLDELRTLISENKAQSMFPVMLLNGLLSNSDQYDRTDRSFVKKLTDMLHAEPKFQGVNPLYIGMSAPGFTGTELSLTRFGHLDVGVMRYEAILEAVMEELQFPKVRGAVIGHSAGGAAVLQYEHETTDNRLAKIALCPAIHLDKAPQFDRIDKALQLQENTLSLLNPLTTKPADFASHIVIRHLLGIPQHIPFATLPKPVQEQITMHVNELNTHRYATHQKLKELHIPLPRGQNTVQAALNIVAERDVLTPPEQIKQGFPEDTISFLTIPDGHHDDIFIYEETQTMVLPLIASYIANRQVDYGLAKELGLVGMQTQVE